MGLGQIERPRHDIWVLLMLSAESEERIRRHFIEVERLPAAKVCRRLHVTLYHARRPIEQLEENEYPLGIVTQASNWRMMAMAPGGENPRADIDAARKSVGIRIQRGCDAGRRMLAERAKYFRYETREVLGSRLGSDLRRSAFGARSYQPHMTVLRPDAGHTNNLSPLGERFRSALGLFAFDRVLVRKYEPEQ